MDCLVVCLVAWCVLMLNCRRQVQASQMPLSLSLVLVPWASRLQVGCLSVATIAGVHDAGRGPPWLSRTLKITELGLLTSHHDMHHQKALLSDRALGAGVNRTVRSSTKRVMLNISLRCKWHTANVFLLISDGTTLLLHQHTSTGSPHPSLF